MEPSDYGEPWTDTFTFVCVLCGGNVQVLGGVLQRPHRKPYPDHVQECYGPDGV